MKTTVTNKPPKRKQSQFLPVMGLIVAICVGVIAYFGAPLLVDLVPQRQRCPSSGAAEVRP